MATDTKTPPSPPHLVFPNSHFTGLQGPQPPHKQPPGILLRVCTGVYMCGGLWCQLRLLWEQLFLFLLQHRQQVHHHHPLQPNTPSRWNASWVWSITAFFYSKTLICVSLSHACTFDYTEHACHNLKYLPFALVCSHCVHTPFCVLTISRLGYSESASWIRCSWVKLEKDTPALWGRSEWWDRWWSVSGGDAQGRRGEAQSKAWTGPGWLLGEAATFGLKV